MCISPVQITKNGQMYDVPCGKCIDCVNHRASDWRQRCLLECKTTDKVFFVTLTIDDEHLPKTLGLVHPSKRMIQLFHKRLRIFITRRKLNLTFKYFLASEYGPQTKNQDKVKSKFKRPHYHALYFVNGVDAKYFPCILKKIWNCGFSSIEECRSKERSSSYIVKYVSASGTNPYFGNELKFDDYVSYSERSSFSAFFDARTYNTFCLHSTSIGKKYFQEVLAPRFKKNLAEIIKFLRSQNVNIVRIIKHFSALPDASSAICEPQLWRAASAIRNYTSGLVLSPLATAAARHCSSSSAYTWPTPQYLPPDNLPVKKKLERKKSGPD